ncbi:hypothetical protein N0V82_009500 [Gnomoniopsis sp. IMI 355080]|nr:hypothetical protein N0V82_009500 [Gnomoniopsis sp. IMI 355080]
MASQDETTAAKLLIERIRFDHTPQGHSTLSSIIRDALEILSTELYDTSSHFLLEFLQNADDNTYSPSVVPRVQFAYTASTLRVDCNEVGFTASNVEAICSIRRSTKAGQDHAGRTGEKGIGFKSVFKIADVVWLSSRQFTFKFDKKLEFGMIAPVWAEFPQPALQEHTSFLLQLDHSCDENMIVESLRNFNPTHLLFLRRIRHVSLVVATDSQQQTIEFRRRDVIDESGSMTIIERNERYYKYITVSHRTEQLPKEPKRPNTAASELVLAFPVFEAKEAASPWKAQDVHAVLPIGNYGLKALRNAIVDAFTSSVERLKCGSMKFLWPGFIPSQDAHPFFRSTRQDVIASLLDRPVLESLAGHLAAPSQLAYVDERFTDNGEPLTLFHRTKNLYLSRKYPDSVLESLCGLGVARLSDEAFVEHLKQMIQEDEGQFRAKSLEWHSKLAGALIPLTSNEKIKEVILTLPMIPIVNGTWVAAVSKPYIFLEALGLGDLRISKSLRIIHPVAITDASRVHLWTSLGIQHIDRQEICQFIVKAHEQPLLAPHKSWTRSHLIAHARFLHQSKWRPSKPVDLWMEDSKERRCRSSQLYSFEGLHYDERTSRVIEKLRETFPTVHEDYFAAIKPATDLQVQTGRANDLGFHDPVDSDDESISVDPNFYRSASPSESKATEESQQGSGRTSAQSSGSGPVISPFGPGGENITYALSREFKHLFAQCDVADVLHVLVSNWQHYSKLIDKSSELEIDDEIGIDELRKSLWSRVGETDGVRSTELDMNLAKEMLLDNIGDVLVQTNLGRTHLRDLVLPDVDALFQDDTQILLPVLKLWKCRPEEKVRLEVFGVSVAPDATFYIKCLRSLHRLQTTPSPGSVVRIYEEIQSQYDGSAQSFIRQRLDHVDTMQAASIVKPLRTKKIFPISDNETSMSANTLDRLLSGIDQIWYIADTSALCASFVGRVPLLALQPIRIRSLASLLTALKLNSRKLSMATIKRSAPRGKRRFQAELTEFLRSRWSFVAA